jgi:anti-sigma regulatory factor (Ser/Thr protein kinase)
MTEHRLTLSLPATPTAARVARHRAVDAIAGWNAGLRAEVVQTAELLISELVTNAVQYAGAEPVLLAVSLKEAVLRIEVRDSSPVLPKPALPCADSEGGRGLFLVTALADRYHAEPAETGKRCWAEIDLSSASRQEVGCSLLFRGVDADGHPCPGA